MKHQLDATLCRFYFCKVTLHVSGASAHHQEYLKLARRPLVHVLSLQVGHHISLLGPVFHLTYTTMHGSTKLKFVLILFTIMPYLIINTYVSLMYELKKNGKVFTSKSVGTEPSSYEKGIYRAAVSQKLRNTHLDDSVWINFKSLTHVPTLSIRT